MNCKQGDLALIICGQSQGQAVTCLEALPEGFRRDDLPRGINQRISEDEGPLWRLDRPIEWGDLLYLAIAPDAVLMPIGRGSPQAMRDSQQWHSETVCDGSR